MLGHHLSLFLQGITVALRPLMKSKTIKRRTKKFTQHQSDQYGIWKFLVHSHKELEMLLLCNKSHYAEMGPSVFSNNQKAIVKRAA